MRCKQFSSTHAIGLNLEFKLLKSLLFCTRKECRLRNESQNFQMCGAWEPNEHFMYVCIFLQQYHIHMDIGNSKNYLGIMYLDKFVGITHLVIP